MDTGLLSTMGGLVLPDAYSTAWVARVPAHDSPSRPAWPETVNYLRCHQLEDGGWGEPSQYYAHERTISTLSALLALRTWGESPQSARVQRGLCALQNYASDLLSEPYEPIGFELLLPRLAVELEQQGVRDLPSYPQIEQMAAEKAALIGALKPDYNHPRSWWFNLEMLLPYQLQELDDRVLNQQGSVAVSPAATAAYLRALRLVGKDSPKAAAYLQQLISRGKGGVGLCYPIDSFEVIWTLDYFRNAGASYESPKFTSLLRWLADYWKRCSAKAGFSQSFAVSDGDDTAVAYSVLKWAGYHPSDTSLLGYWNEDTGVFQTYPDERNPSVSTAVHGLNAFSQDPDNPEHEKIARRLVQWLRNQMDEKDGLYDKWHISPFYSTSRVIPALICLDEPLAEICIQFLQNKQHMNGGWGNGCHSTLEETSLAILGLVSGYRAGLLKDRNSLAQAADYMNRHHEREAQERLWIGKALYQPVGVVRSLIRAAKLALTIEGIGPFG